MYGTYASSGPDGLVVFVFLAVWVVCWFLAVAEAATRGHDAKTWGVAGLILGPLALACALVAPYSPDLLARALRKQPVDDSGEGES